MSVADWAQIITAVGTMILAAWAIVTASANRAAVREMRESRIAQERPYVVVDLDYSSRYPFVNVVVRNVGVRSARCIKFCFSSALWDYDDRDLSVELGYFHEGLEVLAPGAEIHCLLGNRQQVIGKFREHGLDKQGVTVVVAYRAFSGERFEDRWTLNPALFAQRRLAEPEKTLETISTYLENLVYVQTLETRRSTWRRMLNVRAYDPNSLSDQISRHRWHVHWSRLRRLVHRGE